MNEIMVATIIRLVGFGLLSLMMIGIGISQLRSKEPVGFYSGEEHPKKEEITDVRAWNKKHGTMWVVYGIVIFISSIRIIFIGDGIFSVILLSGGTLVPVVIMMWYHSKLTRLYRKK